MAPEIIWCSCTWRDNHGRQTRIKAAAKANAPKILPTTEALKPRSCPSTGTTKVCTSQQDESNQLTPNKRRIIGSASKSSARRGAAFSNAGGMCSSGALRTQNHVTNGNKAISKNAQRKPVTWAGSGPA